MTLSLYENEYLLTFSSPSEMSLYSYRMTLAEDGCETAGDDCGSCVLVCGNLELPSSENGIPAALFACFTLTERDMTSVSVGNRGGRDAEIAVFTRDGKTVTVCTDRESGAPFNISLADADGNAVFTFEIESYTP